MVHLKILAWQFLKNLGPCKAALESLQADDSDGFVCAEHFADLIKVLDRIAAIMKFMAVSLFTTHDMSDFNDEVGLTLKPSEDAVWLAGYTGKSPLERGLSDIVKTSGAWTSITDELVKTAGSSTKLRPEMDRAVETLQNIKDGKLELTQARLDDLNHLFPQLQSGMRRCDLEEAKQLMVSALTANADSCMEPEDGGDGKVSSKFVSALLKGLKIFSNVPGLTTKAEALEKWMTAHVKEMALNDLVDLAAPGFLDHLEPVQALVTKLAKVTIPDDRPECGLAACRLLNFALNHLIAEARFEFAIFHPHLTHQHVILFQSI